MRRDAYWWAGHLTCRHCPENSYPADAVWLGPDLLLARYRPACPHLAEQVRLVQPSTLRVDDRCAAVLPAGTRCSDTAGPDGLCPAHDSARTPQ